MPSPPILDLEALLAPLSGADPAGEPLSIPVKKKLDDARKEINPNKFAPNDPQRPEKYQPADWPGIEQLAQDTLARSSKDLQVAARLTEALVKQYGFRGLRDGLRLLRRLAADCWDRVHPIIQDGDVEVRAGPFIWLDDDFKGARFPNALRAVSLTGVNEGQNYGWQQWHDAQEAPGGAGAQEFEKAVAATPREFCERVVDDIAECVNELIELTKVLSAKMGEAAPDLIQVRKALLECQELAQQILQLKPAPVPAQNGAAPATGSAAAAAPPAAAPAAPRPLTRDDLLARLAEASALLLQMEPHSPIAYLIQRAVRLARLPLPELMRVLVRDQNVLGQLDRDLDLGLEKQEAAKSPKGK